MLMNRDNHEKTRYDLPTYTMQIFYALCLGQLPANLSANCLPIEGGAKNVSSPLAPVVTPGYLTAFYRRFSLPLV